MKTNEFANLLEKNTDYVVMGRGATNAKFQIAYLMHPWGGAPEPRPMRTPVRIRFRKDAVNAYNVEIFHDDCREATIDDYQTFHKLFYQYINTPILDRMGDDGYWALDYPEEVRKHSNYEGLKELRIDEGGLS